VRARLEADQEVGDVERRDVIDLGSSALGEEPGEPREVAAIGLERQPRQAALDLHVIEEQIHRLIEAQPARHALSSATWRCWQVLRGCSRPDVRP
jgi:hypothetical protein